MADPHSAQSRPCHKIKERVILHEQIAGVCGSIPPPFPPMILRYALENTPGDSKQQFGMYLTSNCLTIVSNILLSFPQKKTLARASGTGIPLRVRAIPVAFYCILRENLTVVPHMASNHRRENQSRRYTPTVICVCRATNKPRHHEIIIFKRGMSWHGFTRISD